MLQRFRDVRSHSVRLADGLSDADATVQSMDDASPTKWHLAHTSWFFETFLLRDHVVGYAAFNDRYAYLFNSYYEAEGERHARPERGLLTRPSLADIFAYRTHVDAAMVDAMGSFADPQLDLVELGLHHEQQHQELLLTDILHLFSRNPLKPAYAEDRPEAGAPASPVQWIEGPTGLHSMGHDGDAFAFDCEGPRHDVLLHPHALADRPVSNGEWLEFIEGGGYRDPAHWLSDGWAWVQDQRVDAPLYWNRESGTWMEFGLAGNHALDRSAPVKHISLYEADAYAAWAGARLPTEAEWEVAAGRVLPNSGHVWEWTGSAYRPYPGFRPATGAVGEYNGKFMSGQFVLKGGSVATSPGHMRPSYRNFFYPHQRWQFTGLRLAKDL
ncbi:ergothioneine biosynthesis protein EgtB [Parasphingorhabdus sp.]|uniref:ergothioneine biosynthesis protein EgtB n=1 Tax=Parasphingorhabdus sp. TaxID=2709688 RepID=UPI0030033429